MRRRWREGGGSIFVCEFARAEEGLEWLFTRAFLYVCTVFVSRVTPGRSGCPTYFNYVSPFLRSFVAWATLRSLVRNERLVVKLWRSCAELDRAVLWCAFFFCVLLRRVEVRFLSFPAMRTAGPSNI